MARWNILPRFEHRRQKADARLEPVQFAPVVRNPLVPQTKVRMLQSVGGKFEDGKTRWELVSGRDYWLDDVKADEFIIKGYCSGNLSREYTTMEQEAIRSNVQIVSMQSTSKEFLDG